MCSCWFLPCFLFFLQFFFVFSFDAEATSHSSSSRLHIVGSTALYPFSTAVAERFGWQEGAKTPLVEANGTGGGFRIFCQSGGRSLKGPDMVNASRPLEPLERQYCASQGITDLQAFKVGHDAVILGVHQEALLKSLSLKHLFKALAKELLIEGVWVENPYRLWSEIDARLPPEKIGFLGPPPSSGTYAVLVEGVLKPQCPRAHEKCLQIRRDGVYLPLSEQENVVVQKLLLNPHKIGIFSFSFLHYRADLLRPLTLEDVPPTLETIQQGTYPLSRYLFLYTRTSLLQKKPEVRAFINAFYAPSAVGKKGYLTRKGFIPLKKRETF